MSEDMCGVQKYISRAELEKRNKIQEEKHLEGGCCGEWTWRRGSLKVDCQGCGYTMAIDPATRKLKPLGPNEAMQNYMQSHGIVLWTR